MYVCMCVCICVCTEHGLCSVLCCTLGIAFPTWAVFGGFILLSVHLLNEALFFLVLFPSHCCFQIFSANPPYGEINYNTAFERSENALYSVTLPMGWSFPALISLFFRFGCMTRHRTCSGDVIDGIDREVPSSVL